MKALNFLTVKQIKDALWKGEHQKEVAERFGISQPTISRILHGEQWYEVPWPDGSLGALSTYQQALILKERHSVRSEKRFRRVLHSLTPEAKQQLLSPEAYQEEMDRIAAEEERALVAAVTVPEGEGGSVSIEQDKDLPPDFDEAEWEEVARKAPDNKFVKMAIDLKDQNLKLSIIATFEILPEDQWEGDLADRYIAMGKSQLDRSG